MEKEDKEALARYQQMLDQGIPLLTHVLMPPWKIFSESGSLVIEAANSNLVGAGNKATVVRIVLPGGMAMQLRDLLNKSSFAGSEEIKPAH